MGIFILSIPQEMHACSTIAIAGYDSQPSVHPTTHTTVNILITCLVKLWQNNILLVD